jgi:restriction system protein
MSFMAVPDFQTLMLPVLKQFADGAEKSPSDIRGPIAAEFKLTPEDLTIMLPSGRQTTFANRVAWALGDLKQASLVVSPSHAHYRLTERGREILKSPPDRIDIAFLEKYPDFQEFRNRTGVSVGPPRPQPISATHSEVSESPALTPDEQIHLGARRIHENLVAQLLERVRAYINDVLY